MPIKHDELEIDINNPFQNCQFNRKQYANVLTSIVEDNASGFVLALNNKWGTGKTTFVKMWQQMLKNEGYSTLYFNAWENDFDDNPLVALMAELQTLSTRKTSKSFASLVKTGAVLSKNVLPGLIKAIAEKYIDIKAVTDVLENATKGVTEILSDEIEKYAEKKKALKEFREEMVKYTQEVNSDKPLVFIIDELDRCRPSFSVELLEQIKHFFSVKGIIFILSIDKEQLGYAIKGFYGSDKLNVEEYLRRFIDLEFIIPEPDIEKAIPYFIDYYNFQEFFSNPSRIRYSDLSRDFNSFKDIANILFQTRSVTLRQLEKLFSHARITLKSFEINDYVLPGRYISLIYLKFFFSDIFTKVSTYAYSPQELLDALFSTYPGNISGDNINAFLYLEANICSMYCLGHPEYKYRQILHELANSNEYQIDFKSQLNTRYNGNQDLAIVLRDVLSRIRFNGIPLSFLLDKINLKEKLLK
jgi:hypothetical protein